MKKGKFLSFKLPERKDTFSGIVLNSNEEWILIKNCIDYRLDGYIIFANDKDIELSYGSYEKLATTILKKKGYDYRKDIAIPMNNIDAILETIAKRYTLMQLDATNGDASDVVKFLGRKGSFFLFRELTVAGKWRYKLELPKNEVVFISFDNDYLNSLKLLVNNLHSHTGRLEE